MTIIKDQPMTSENAGTGPVASAMPAGSLVVAGIIVAAGVAGLLAMDMAGSRMFLSMVEAGLAWCF